MIGQILGGRYELKEIIGDGGMSTVYKAHCRVLDRIVAVKVLRSEFSRDAGFVERFNIEAQAVGKINHPNIVNIFDVGQDGNVHYIVMEYVEGKCLKDLIVEQGSIPVETALDIMVMVLDGLHHAHEKGIIHRDIKPQNILITSIGMVKVADFGIAKAVGSGTITADDDRVMGTVQYMAPEQARGEPVTRAVDIYSAGCMMYEMLTGQVPFNADQPMTIAMKHAHDELLAPSEINPDIPAGLEGIIFRAMEKVPRNRFATAEEMRNALVSFRSRYLGGVGAGVPGEDYSRYRQGTAVLERSQLIKRVVAAAIIVIVLGVGAGVLYVLSDRFSLFGQEVPVPDLTGMTVAQATDVLAKSSLGINVLAEKYDEKIPSGQITTQDPKANTNVKEDRVINVTVSKGTKDVEVIDVTGLKRADAISRLEKSGLEVDKVEEVFDTEAAVGTVVSQTPGSGKRVKAGSSVSLQISKGPENPGKIVIPNLVGMDVTEAAGVLKANKLVMGNIEQRESNDYYVDEIISQAAEAGTETKEGAAIDVVVSSGPGPVQKNRIIEIKLPSEKDIYDVVIIVHDGKGDRTAYEETHHGNDTVYAGIDYYGSGTAEVYLNGQKHQSIKL